MYKDTFGYFGQSEFRQMLIHNLPVEKFEDYISLPQKFACDDLEATEKMVASQLMKSTSKIFLMGMGHVKSGLIHRLKKYFRTIEDD